MFETKHLIIKEFTEEDAKAFYELTQDDGFNLFPITRYRQESEASALEWIRNVKGKLAVWEKRTRDLVGMGGLTPWEYEGEKLIDITYRLRQSHWGKGYGFELAKGLVDFGFKERDLDQITATITPDNLASKSIAMKLGFVFDKHITLLGVPTDLYRLLK